MSKKKHKKKHNNLVNQKPVEESREELELSAKTLFDTGDYARAREKYKKLLKFDNNLYVPLLLQCYKMILKKQIKSGNVSEAQRTIFAMKQFGCDDSVKYEQVELAAREGKYSSGLPIALEICSNVKKSNDPAECIITAADTIILAFNDLSLYRNRYTDIVKEATAVQQSLEFVSQERYDDALMNIKTIGYSSPLSHWRLFIKGLCAYYQGDDNKAEKSFAAVPKESLLQSAVSTYLALLDYSANLRHIYKDQLLIKNICCVLGFSEYKDILPRAEYLWRIGRKKDSFVHVRTSIRDFPRKEIFVHYFLAQFYFNAVETIHEQKICDYLDGIFYVIDKYGTRNSFEEYLSRRTEVLNSSIQSMRPDQYEKLALDYMSADQKMFVNNIKAEALLYCYLGKKIQQRNKGEFFPRMFSSDNGTIKDTDKAEEYFLKAYNLSAGDISIATVLLDFYKKIKNKSKQNKLLDKMVVDFPEDKNIVLRAGFECISRNALVKGREYLEKAFALDPADHKCLETLVSLYFQLAIQAASKSKQKTYRELFRKMQIHCRPGNSSILFNSAFFHVRWAIVEYIAGVFSEGDAHFEKAKSETDDQFSVAYFMYCQFLFYPVNTPVRKEVSDMVDAYLKKEPSISTALAIKRFLFFFSNYEILPFWFYKEESRFDAYIINLVKTPCPAFGIREILLYYMTKRDGLKYTELRKIEQISNAMKKQYKDNYFFRYTELFVKTDNFKGNYNSKTTLDSLDNILSDAVVQNDQWLVAEVKRNISAINNRREKELIPPMPDLPDFNTMPDVNSPEFKAFFDLLQDNYDGDELEDIFLPAKRQSRKKR